MSTTSNSPKSRNWCLTINNYTDAEYLQTLENSRTDYIIVGKEVGALGVPHLQCYARFSNAVRLATLKKIFPRAHMEIAKGTPEQNFIYCSKENNFEEAGERPSFSKHVEGMMYLMDCIMETYEDLMPHANIEQVELLEEQRSFVNDLGVELCDLKCEFDGIDLNDFPCSESSFTLTPRVIDEECEDDMIDL